jgi:GTP cyclohydrolase IA
MNSTLSPPKWGLIFKYFVNFSNFKEVLDFLRSWEMENREKNLADWLRNVTSNEDAIKVITASEDRIVRAYSELLSGYDIDPSKILNEVEKVKNYSGLVVEREIQFTSICGHHFLPFFGSIDIIYQPGEIITGLGKIPRLAQAYAKRFQLQEFLNQQVAEQLMESIGARGVYVKSTATHLCIHSRGPSDRNSETVCTYSKGTLSDPSRTNEVLQLLKSGGS